MKTAEAFLPELFPESWAESFGQDRFGLWHGVYVGDIAFRFRWIPPGQFLMGSPEDEPSRWSAEGPQQQITFEKGFWLAETACTQELWQVVMGNNPSRFTENTQNPVEKVSWDDCQEFIIALNTLKPTLKSRLPSEAEWEYACRAGTDTPFWFGHELSTDEANYNGNYPYNNGQKGGFRKKTLPVKSFRCNPWGLYQMHGNVWEWCEDEWQDNHEGADPNGRPRLTGENNADHVCRGGSWGEDGGSLRAAYRRNWLFDDFSSGFRLARGPESSS